MHIAEWNILSLSNQREQSRMSAHLTIVEGPQNACAVNYVICLGVQRRVKQMITFLGETIGCTRCFMHTRICCKTTQRSLCGHMVKAASRDKLNSGCWSCGGQASEPLIAPLSSAFPGPGELMCAHSLIFAVPPEMYPGRWQMELPDGRTVVCLSLGMPDSC